VNYYDQNYDLKIFYGSQTGTAEGFSFNLRDESNSLGLKTLVIDLEKYNSEKLSEEKPLVMFLLATYGEGEPTDNAKEFYTWLLADSRPADLLKGLRYVVFGLGNKTYENYNAIGKKAHKRLQELGATPVIDLGMGDDDANLEEDFKKWKRVMWPAVTAALGKGSSSNTDALADEVQKRRYTLKIHNDLSADSSINLRARFTPTQPRLFSPRGQGKDTFVYDLKTPYLATIVINEELHTSLSDRSCRHVELKIDPATHPSLSYAPGDHLGVYPQNSRELVERMMKRLKIPDPHKVISLVPIDGGSGEGIGPITIETAFLYFVDITNPPRQALLKVLAECAADPNEKTRLLHLCSPKGQDEFLNTIKQPMMSIFELLERHPSLQPPLDLILEILPRLAPRYYSISSSLRKSPDRVSITVAVLTFSTGTGRVHQGVASSWLKDLSPGHQIPIFVRKSNFRLPPDPRTPIIMVGPGTGLAPFRSFILERATLPSTGENFVFFGCRHSKHDFIYEKELTELAAQGKIALFTAFSREQEKKVYVQHRISENWQPVANLLRNEKAHVYVCGDARQMPADVHKALVGALEKSGLSHQDAENFMQAMHKDGRYQQDVWF
jgi:NADPH-ferrihemoprotein reductase